MEGNKVEEKRMNEEYDLSTNSEYKDHSVINFPLQFATT